MKAVVFNGDDLELKEVPEPIISEDQVLIKVKAVGICGTDIAISNGTLPTPTPLILGHEFSGEVSKLGERIKGDWLGKKVTAEINSNIDFNCYFCSRKQYTQCLSRKAIGIDIDGAMAEYIAVNSYLIHEIPDNLSYAEATFIEPLAAAYQIFERMQLENDDKIIAIFGLGKLGLLSLQVAKEKGLRIIAIDGSDKKLSLAKDFGAEFLINRFQDNDMVNTVKKCTKQVGADIVLDTTGNPDVMDELIAACKTRGKLHLKSTHGVAVPMNLTELVVREITLYTSRCGSFIRAIEGLSSGKIVVKDLITNTFPLVKFREAFNSYEQSHDTIKTIILI